MTVGKNSCYFRILLGPNVHSKRNISMSAIIWGPCICNCNIFFGFSFCFVRILGVLFEKFIFTESFIYKVFFKFFINIMEIVKYGDEILKDLKLLIDLCSRASFTNTIVIHLFIRSWFEKMSSRHLHSQTIRARDRNFWHNIHQPLCVMWHMSSVTYHMSGVSCHMSGVTYDL